MASAVVQSLGGREAAPPAPPIPLGAPAAAPVFPLFDRLLRGMVAAGQGIQALCLLLGLTRLALQEHIVRLCLPAPHDRPLRKPGPKAWSVKDKIRTIYWRLLGVHPEIIGERLDVRRTANAVRAQTRRLGVPTPARRDLHKPDPASLPEPDLGSLFRLLTSNRRQSAVQAGPTELRTEASAGAGDLLEAVPAAAGRTAARSAKPAAAPPKRASGGQVKPAGQQELQLLVAVGGAQTGQGKDARSGEIVSAVALPPIPKTEDEVDLSGDLTWFRRLTWTNPLKNRVAVWVCFILIAGGLHYKAAAARLGISAAAFRSVRTRMAVPVDPDRSKAGTVFDEDAARITVERSGYVIGECIESKHFFWKHRDDRKTRFSPPFRKSEKIIGERSNLFTRVTRAMLNVEHHDQHTPFATSSARMCA